tara:strand:+ start:120 stop:1745 length:1626 start_codon:yes stop_codon:yes gene_type:complete
MSLLKKEERACPSTPPPIPSAANMSHAVEELIPNAYKTAMSLRCMGYNNYDACMDLIDNSIDAARGSGAEINVIIKSEQTGELTNSGNKKKKISSITIQDNGKGMDLNTLKQAVRYGSETPHGEVDLGKFGMGLNTASTSMGTRFEVTTTTGDGVSHKAVFDIETFKKGFKYDFYSVDLPPGTPSGTSLKILKLDNMKCWDPKSFSTTLIKKVAQTFRHLLSSSNITIKVNRTIVKPYDPLFWDDPNTVRYTPSWVGIPGYKTVEYRVCSVRKTPSVIGSMTTNQGISWIRNQREIGANVTKPFWQAFPDYRGFLVEIRYSGDELDSELNLNIQKRLAPESLSQSLIDCIEQEIMPYHRQNHKEYKKEQGDKSKLKSKDLDKQLAAYGTKMKTISKSLHMPEIQKVKKSTSSDSSSTTKTRKKGGNTDTKKGSIQAHRTSHLGRNFVFERTNWTAQGPMMIPSFDGNNIIIGLNDDHPFIAKTIEKEGKGMNLSFVLGLLAAMGLAQLTLPEDPDITAAYDKFSNSFNRNCAELVNKIPKV